MKVILSFSIALFCVYSAFSQPMNKINYDLILKDIEVGIDQGQKRSLRDLATLLDKDNISNKCRSLLRDNLFVPEDIFKLDKKFNKQQFLDFYYEHEKEIQYSNLMEAFYIQDLKDVKIEYEVQAITKNKNVDLANLLRENITQVDEHLNSKNYKELDSAIDQLIELEMIETYDYISRLLGNKIVQKANDGNTVLKICDFISTYRSETSAKKIIELEKLKVIPRPQAVSYLAKITNLELDFHSDLDKSFKFYMDSLGTIEDMVVFGFEKEFNFKMNFFEFPVDYYGKILSQHSLDSWIEQNALHDLTETGNPRSLYYLATLIYKHRAELNEKEGWKYYQLLEKLSGVEVLIQNSSGNKVSLDKNRKDKAALLNFIAYWAQHYKDYEWDVNQSRFINKVEVVEQTKSYERLFRRLNSTNDSVAIEAYVSLTEGDPNSITELANKYRQLLRNYNKSLPTFQYQFLEQLTSLTDYCRRNNIQYIPRKHIQSYLTRIKTVRDKSERYQLENELLKEIDLKDITALEYWTCLHQQNLEVSFSMGRIIDRFYSDNWNSVAEDQNQLRLYLKKAGLFEKFGIDGVCNAYLKKINREDPEIQKKLTRIAATESDNEISSKIQILLQNASGDKSNDLDAFLQSPGEFNKRDIKILAAPDENVLEKIIERLSTEEDRSSIKNLLVYLKNNGDISHVPYLFKIIDSESILSSRKGKTVTLSDAVTVLLENIYSYKFRLTEEQAKRDPWNDLWKSNKNNYTVWGKNFFKNKIEELKAAETLAIDDINLLIASEYYDDSFKSIVLESLAKVSPQKNVRRLDLEPKLNVDSDLKYFENFDFSHKELDDIPKLFEIEDGEKMAEFIIRKSKSFDVNDRGSFFNNLFRSGWFENYVNQGQLNVEMATVIKNTLKEYLAVNNYLSEFEEQNTYLHIAQINNIGLTLEEKLQATRKLEIDEGSKAKIQQNIIATISYEEIGTVLEFADKLTTVKGSNTCSFLARDFGLPIYDDQDIYALKKAHKELNQKEFYFKILTDFGIDFKSNGELDFDKIYNILQFDIVSPFIGEGGGKRDYCTYGIIKVLEQHFNTRLGFHEKLNEAQTFYTFSSTKRSKAWIKYLIDKNLIKINKSIPPSYNFVSVEE